MLKEDLPAGFARRKPLDGLRGVLAMVVVLFHLKQPGFAQGFAGVDGFFVVSGFVITSIIVHEVLTNKTLDFYRFYARRTKRLLPASATVLIVSAIGYKQFAAPLLVSRNRMSFLAGSCYIENFYLIELAKDYFAQSVEESPVMHYWSLGVEEQFYFLWPITLFCLSEISILQDSLTDRSGGNFYRGPCNQSAQLLRRSSHEIFWNSISNLSIVTRSVVGLSRSANATRKTPCDSLSKCGLAFHFDWSGRHHFHF